ESPVATCHLAETLVATCRQDALEVALEAGTCLRHRAGPRAATCRRAPLAAVLAVGPRRRLRAGPRVETCRPLARLRPVHHLRARAGPSWSRRGHPEPTPLRERARSS